MPDIRAVSATVVVISGALAGFAGYRAWQAHQAPATQLIAAAVDKPATVSEGTAHDTSGQSGHAASDESPVRPAVPDRVPALTLPDLDGRPHSLQEFLGHPLIINFWATWCPPCRREIPLLLQLRRTRRTQQLEIVGIAVDFKAAVKDYIKRTPLDYPVLIGEDQGMMAAEKFGMEPVLPFSVFSDAQGRIVAVKIGELHRAEADYILDTMQALAAGQQSLEEARSRIAQRLRELAVARAQGRAP